MPLAHCLQEVVAQGKKVFKFEDFIQLGMKHPVLPIRPAPEDVCTIMFTSGTSGNPKASICSPDPADGA